jgi:tRNA-specific adenosine deaminase 3
VYLTKEPNAYEAMALVHSRVRRVVFGKQDKEMGGLGGVYNFRGIHCLPGTNHHYRAFRLSSETTCKDSDAQSTRNNVMLSLKNLHPDT